MSDGNKKQGDDGGGRSEGRGEVKRLSGSYPALRYTQPTVALITPDSGVRLFYIPALAEVYQQAYGGHIVSLAEVQR